MLRNNVYNLMLQLVQESKGIARIKNEYTRDAVGAEDIMGFWRKLEKEKEASVEELQVLIRKYSDNSYKDQ